MAGPSHADLTGADLHEPKGADSAAADTLYAANGTGSGAWRKVTSASIDTSSIKNINKFFLTSSLANISSASSIYVPVPVDATLTKVTTVLQGVIATANATLTVANYALSTIGTITVAYSGSAAGDVDTLNAVSNNTFLAGTWVKITTNAASTNAVEVKIVLEFTYG